MMTIMQGLFILTAVLSLLVILCAAVIWVERKFSSEKYDERQKIARGNGYRVSFWVSAVYYLIVMSVMIFQVEKPKTVEPYLLIFGGLILQVMASHIYCILTHAALPLSEKPWVAVICYLFSGALQLLTNDYSEPFPLVGRGSEAWVRLMTAVSFFMLAAMHLISLLRREKE